MHAVRNIRLCTKDCLCLYVCPTGATDTETGQVDAAKCTGCGACANACPSHAISMVPKEYPPQQPKSEEIRNAMMHLLGSKAEQEQLARKIAKEAGDPMLIQLAEAAAKSNRLMGEDICREAGYMLPQSGNTHRFLQGLLDTEQGEDYPEEAVKRLLELIQSNED